MKNIPLLNRDLFFDNPDITYSRISPCGNYITFLKEYEGILNIWIKHFDDDFGKSIPLTNSKSPILGFFWSYDSKYLMFINDNNGDENFNVFKLEIEENIQRFPEVFNLTPLKEVTAQIYLVSRMRPNIIMIGLNDRDKAWHDLYKLNIETGDLELIEQNDNRLGGWEFDWNENNRLAYRTTNDGNQEILNKNEDGSYTKLFEISIKESARVIGWTEDNELCYLATNKGKGNFLSLYTLDPNNGELKLIDEDPSGRSDLNDVYIDSFTKSLIYTEYNYDRKKKNWINIDIAKDFSAIDEKFGNYDWDIISRDKTFSKFLIQVDGDTKISEVYYFNRKTLEIAFQYTTRKKLKEFESFLAPMHFFEFKSSDNVTIPSYLSLPRIGEKPYPTIALIHGGPKGPRDEWGFNSIVQFLTNRGYAVFQPNFRASGGFGKEFLNAGDKEWGKKMQDDITFGIKHLIEQGISDESKIGIMGGSYGGYATLAGLAFTPDLYSCGVDIVGPSNLFTLLETIPPYWEAGRKWLYEMVGDPDTEEGKKLLREASPLFSSDKINKPLMIVQGANDPRVKISESEQIVEALINQNKPVYYLCADDEGHGFRKPLNNLALYAAIERFLAKYLGGRFQESMSQEVADGLNTLTVNDLS